MDYIWAKFKQNRFLTCGQLLFDFCGHPLLSEIFETIAGLQAMCLCCFVTIRFLSVSFETVNHATTLHWLQLKLDLNVSGCSHAVQVALSSS